jgi:hypothetical protein
VSTNSRAAAIDKAGDKAGNLPLRVAMVFAAWLDRYPILIVEREL